MSEFLDPAHLVTPKYWGETGFVKPSEGKKVSKMVTFVTEDVAGYSADEKSHLEKVVWALSAEAGLPAQAAVDARDATLIAEGRRLLGEDGLACTDCHAWREETGGRPVLEDLEAIGSLTPLREPEEEGDFQRYWYRYPEQETKLRTGSSCTLKRSRA